MPQLDHVTYFSQSFWLTVFFLAFYVILVKTFLPKVSTILKLRKKLTDPRHQESHGTQAEAASEISSYDRILMTSLQSAKSLISETSEASQKWSSETLRSVQLSHLAPSQEKYVQAVGQLIAKKHVLKSLLEEAK